MEDDEDVDEGRGWLEDGCCCIVMGMPGICIDIGVDTDMIDFLSIPPR